MKKFLALLIIIISFTNIKAQFDTEHWFAPFADRSGFNGGEQYLYLSTDRTTPFNVEIYNNNVLYKTVQISKGNPGKVSIDGYLMMTENVNDMYSVKNMGLHLVGDFKYFAQFRFYVPNHAEIITSKGKAGIGKEFYAYTPEQSKFDVRNFLNSTVGIMATEDNTNIQISNFNNVTLSNNQTVDNTTIQNITLNKNQSYILETINNSQENTKGLTGLNIKADKPITITNGDALFIAPNERNVDIMMDQASPIERLGKDYIAVKGNGNTIQGMEKVLVIATQDNTNIVVNDGSETNFTLAKKGESKVIDGNNYKKPAGATTDAYNMYIKADKEIYAYQLLAGVDDGTNNNFASGGMNILPQLNCLLTSKIEEFADVNEIGSQSQFNTRINIITQKNAVVKFNGSLLSNNFGPFSVLGNNEWETYTVPNVTGNVTIESTKAVTAGVAGGNEAIGFGGYFSGFNANPIISKGGDCDKGNVSLEVDSTYDIYQWYFTKDDPSLPTTIWQTYSGTYSSDCSTAPNCYKILPSESGYYYVHIEKTGCGILDSPVFIYQRCPFKSTQNYVVPDCKPVLTIPTPTFTVSSQTEDYSTLIETVSPQNGTINIDKTTGIITYTLTNFSTNTDTFTVSLKGINPSFPDTEFFTFNIDIKHLNAFNGEVFACYDFANNNAIFNLTNAIITTETNITSIDYYDAGTLINGNPINGDITKYKSVAKTIQAVLTNSFGCTKTVNIDLKYYPITNVNTSIYNSTICDIDFDGIYKVKFSTEVSPTIVVDFTKFNINYFLHDPVTNPLEPVLPDDFNFTTDTTVYVLVTSKNGCTDYQKGIINFKTGTKLPVNNISVPICDNDRNGKETVKISDYVPSNYLYFTTRTDAENPSATSIADSQDISTDTTFYIRTVDPTFCPNIFELHFIFKQPNASTSLKDETICKGTTTEIDAGNTFTYYNWSNGQQGTNLPKQFYGAGTHFVELSSNGCIYKQYFTISEAPVPVIMSVDVVGNSVTVNVSGGTLPYEYSLDAINWQTSNVFTGLNRGLQKVYVRDFYQCTPIEKEFSIINIINAITPNGDGINDVLDYSDLSIYKDVKISIYDRYGTTIFNSKNTNSYIWDGTSNGRKIPTGTYWYVIEWTNPDTNKISQYKGWILVKNRQ